MMARSRTTRSGAAQSWRRSDPLTSLLLVFPLFLVYQIGVLSMPPTYNGADLITSQLLHLLHGQLGAYILVNVALGARLRRARARPAPEEQFDPRLFVPVLLESAIYALTMGSLICFVMIEFPAHRSQARSSHCADRAPKQREPGRPSSSSRSAPASTRSWSSASSWSAAASWLFERALGLRRWIASSLAFAISSVLFSAAHHVIGGEPFRVGVFTYRLLCGLVFATIFQMRGFAVAVYTHALYDIFVLLVRG